MFPGYQVVSASLRVYQSSVTGLPYGSTNLGVLVAEGIAYGATLDAADGAAAGIGTPVLASSTATVGVRTVDVTAITQLLWAGRASNAYRIQYRLRFSTTTDGGSDVDFVTIVPGEAGTNYPTLTVTYEYP
jgi:hypothetical protein